MPTEKIVVVNSKNPNDKFEIEAKDYLPALQDGYNFSQVVTQAREQKATQAAAKGEKYIPLNEGETAPESNKPSLWQQWQQVYQHPQPAVTPAQRIHAKGAEANDRLLNELNNSDKAIQSLLDKKFKTEQQRALTMAANHEPDADKMYNQLLIDKFNKELSKDTRENEALKAQALEDPATARKVLREIGEVHPEKKKQIESDVYSVNAQMRLAQGHFIKDDAAIEKNIEKIKNGELDYDVVHDVLTKKEGLVKSFARSWDERKTNLDLFDQYHDLGRAEGDAFLKSTLDKERENFDPDKPVPVGEGYGGHIGELFGGNAIPMAKATVVGTVGSGVGSFFGSPELGPLLAAAVNTPEYGKLAFLGSIRSTYNHLLDKGMNPDEAFYKAKQQAIVDAAGAAIQGGVQSYVGFKLATGMGVPATPKWSPGFRGIMRGVMKEAGEFGKQTLKLGAADVGITGATEVAKNIASHATGVDRPINENVATVMSDQALMNVSLGLLGAGFSGVRKGIGKAAQLVGSKRNVVLQNVAAQPTSVVDATLGSMVLEGRMPPETAVAVKNEVTQQQQRDARIPADITDTDTRAAINEKLDEYDNLQLQLKGGKDGQGKVSDAFKTELKEKSDNIQFDIEVLKSAPKDQARLINDKIAELQAQNDKIVEKNKDGGTATAEEKQQALRNRKRIAELEKQSRDIEEKSTSLLAKANEVLQKHNDALPGMTKIMAGIDPEGTLKFISEQSQGVDENGNVLPGGIPDMSAYPKELIDAAQKAFPVAKVIRPEENKAVSEVVTIKPNQDAVSEQSTTTVDVRQSSDNGAGMGEGNQLQETAGAQTKNQTPEEILGTEVDLSKEPALPEGERVQRLNKDERGPFTTKSGKQVVSVENGELVVKNKDGGEVSAPTRRKAIREYTEAFDFEHGERAPELPEGSYDQNEVHAHIVETSNNPAELMEVFVNEEPTSQPLSTKERMIAEFGMGKTSEESFARFGDRKNITPRLRRSFLYDAKKDTKPAIEVDEMAREMSDHYGVDIEPQDIIDFMMRFPSGVDDALKLVASDNSLAAAKKFQELTGIKLTRDVAEKLIDQQFAKLDKETQAVAEFNKEDGYENQQQLDEQFWNQWEEREANGSASETPADQVGATGKAGGNEENVQGKDAGVGEPPKPPTTTEPPAGGEEGGRNELDKMAANIPKSGELDEYASKGTIEKYHGETPQNDQTIIVQELLPALQHGEKIIETAKQVFGGKDYVEKTLDYIENSKAPIQSKALMYISLENALMREKQANPTSESIQKLQNLVREKSQAFLRETSLAVNFGKLRKIGEVGFDLSQVTDQFFSAKEREGKTMVEKAMQANADEINKQAAEDVQKMDALTPELQRQIEKGVAQEIEKINKALAPTAKSYADKALKALDNIQKKIRSKSYSDVTGATAFIDAGITTIKMAIKAGVAVSKAVELGIAKIKEKMNGKEWVKEDEFRKDMLDAFTKAGIGLNHARTKGVAEQTLIDNGYGREINIKTSNGVEKRNVLDWKKLAGAEGSVDKLKQNVEEALKAKGYTDAEIKEMQADLTEQYTSIRESIIEKSLTELNRRNKVTQTPEQKSAARKLAELYNYGLFDKDPVEYQEAMSKAVGVKNFEKERYQKVQDLAEAMAKVYNTKVNGRFLSDVEVKAIIQELEDHIRIVLREEATRHGSTALMMADIARTFMDANQRMMLGTIKQIVENPLSGITQNLISGIEEVASGKLTGKEGAALKQRKRQNASTIFKNMVLQGGVPYGNISTSFVNKGKLEIYINKLFKTKVGQGIANTLIGKTHLDAADSFYKAKLTEQNFTHNLLKILQRDRLVNGKMQKGMSKQEALNYVAEKLTGQSYKDAQQVAKQIIDRVNEGGKKIVGDTQTHIDRLANDIVKAALVNGDKVTLEQVTAAYNAAYKAAGRSLGHEANNPVSQGVQAVAGKIEKAIDDAIKAKEYTRAAVLTIQSIFVRNILNPFVGGGTNWMVLKLEKNGLGLVTGLGQMIGGKKIDLASEAGLKDLEKALYQSTKAKDAFMRGAAGGATSVVLGLGALGLMNTEEYRKWRGENKWAARYLDLVTPEILLATMYARDKKMGRYFEQLFNKNDIYSPSTKGIKGAAEIIEGSNKDDNEKVNEGLGKMGEAAGNSFGIPLPWRLARDGQNIWLGATGQEPYKVSTDSKSLMEGALKNGMIDYIEWNVNGRQNDTEAPKGRKHGSSRSGRSGRHSR